MIRPRAAAILAMSVVWWSPSAQAQTDTPPVNMWGVTVSEPAAPAAASPIQQAIPSAIGRPGATTAERSEFVIAPLPIVNPTVDNGVGLVVGYLYPLDPSDATTPPSFTLGAGFATSNGTWGVAGVQHFHFAHDRYRVLAAGSYAAVNYAYFGQGEAAGAAGRSIELEQEGPVGLADGLVLVGAGWYLGGRYQFMKMRVGLRDGEAGDPAIPLPPADLELRTAALGPRLERDTRDNPFYPTSGMVLGAMASFYAESLGGRRSYEAYQAWFSQYLGAVRHGTLAWRFSGCAVASDVPFYDLCQLGKSQDLRGYVIGQYRDRAMVAAQVEYRLQVWRRLGAVLFAGGGEVASSLSRLTWDSVLPGAGGGVRFTVAQRNHVNLRIDYAWGKSSRALYVGVGEAF